MTATRAAGPPPGAVADYLGTKDVEPSFDYRDIWRQEHLAAFTVAKIMERDLLRDVQDAVVEAQSEGIGLEEFQRRLRPVLADKGWWGRQERTDPITGEVKQVQLGSPHRLRIIYQTNMRQARAAGAWQRIQAAKRVVPYLRYRLGASERHRPDHEALDGLVFPVDHPFWNSHYPINGYGCKCWVESLTRRAAAPELEQSLERLRAFPPPTRYRNRRTGETELVPFGVDPGFAYNVGEARLKGLRAAQR